jgi:surface protein
MALQATDLLVINRGGTNYKITAAEFNGGASSGLQGTDLLMIQRGSELYQLSLQDLYSFNGKLQTTDYLLVERGEELYALEPATNVGTAPYLKILVNDSNLNLDSVSLFAFQYQQAQPFNGVPPQIRTPQGDVIFLGTNDYINFNTPIDGVDFYEIYGQFGFVSFAGSRGMTAITAPYGAAQMFPNPGSNFGTGCFFNCEKLEQIHTGMPFQNAFRMFSGCKVFNQDLSTLNTSPISDMGQMFNGCTAYTGIGTQTWDVSNVTVMDDMFNGCSSFNRGLNVWGPALGKVESFARMFKDCQQYSQPMDTWDTSGVGVTNRMDGMFQNCTVFNENLTNWCVTGVTQEPANFATGAPLFAAGNKPRWGTCP